MKIKNKKTLISKNDQNENYRSELSNSKTVNRYRFILKIEGDKKN